ncbi:unnamed protein product [Ectocarpus sp. 12 AP-2014]
MYKRSCTVSVYMQPRDLEGGRGEQRRVASGLCRAHEPRWQEEKRFLQTEASVTRFDGKQTSGVVHRGKKKRRRFPTIFPSHVETPFRHVSSRASVVKRRSDFS